MKDELIILKLGGSLITDKNKPFSIRSDILQKSIEQIINSKERLIVVHGGGSFGHPVAKKYRIANGFDISIDNQVFGLTKTHEAMINLNSIIIDNFLGHESPVISIQPSSIFLKKNTEIILNSIESIESALDLGIIPVLYGDVIFDIEGSFSIISGDYIILELCKNIQKYKVSKVIFAIEKDGIFIEREGNTELLAHTDLRSIDSIKLAGLEKKIDVTGGIRSKLEIIKQIISLKIPVQILNGLMEDYIFKAIMNQGVKCTNFLITKGDELSSDIQKRKYEHIKIPIESDVQHLENFFNHIQLVHNPLPSFDLKDINITTSFFNKEISAPICISAITGGHQLSKTLNRILARAAQEEKIIMSVGSQRIGLMDPSSIESFAITREVAPSIPIIGNIGIGQITSPSFKVSDFIKCIDMISADAMAIHFNPLHELVQSNGNISYKNFRRKFLEIREEIKIPIIAKEVGSGFNRDIAKDLDLLGFDGFDIGGAGGTSFAAIESQRDNYSYEKHTRKLADSFREWGIPTPVSILNVRAMTTKPIIATGGLKNGIDIAKSIVLGADIGGFAFKFLLSAWKDYQDKTFLNTIKEIKTLKDELISAMWLMNIATIENLKGKIEKRILIGKMYEWMNQ